MDTQLLLTWIIILCAAGSAYSTGTVLRRQRSENDVSIANNDSTSGGHLYLEETRSVPNITYLTEPTILQNFTSAENIKNGTPEKTVMEFSISVDAENKTESSPISANFTTAVSAEKLPVTGKYMNDPSVTDDEETERTWPPTTPSTTFAKSQTAEETDKCTPDNCASPGNCNFKKPTGCIRLPENRAQTVIYTIEAPNDSSLIYVEMVPDDEDLTTNGTVSIGFKERGKIQKGWKEIKRQVYVSTGYILTLIISTNGKWFNSLLSYRELEFESQECIISLDEGVLTPSPWKELPYQPNTQAMYLLSASERWNESSVWMTLSFIDFDEGDCLLVGAGIKPYAGPKPYFFTGQTRESRDYYIASADVYILFVSGSYQRMDKKGFQIKWKRSGTTIIKPDEKADEETVPDYILQSTGLCFYNRSIVDEFNNRTEDKQQSDLQKFRETLARVAMRYAKSESIKLHSEILASSVKIIRVSYIFERIEHEMPDGGVYVMVSIVESEDTETAVFRRHQLEEIIDQLDAEDEKHRYPMLGYKVGHCPSFGNATAWYIIAGSLLLVSTVVLIFVWICSSVEKRRVFPNAKKRSRHSEILYCKEPEVPARENDYIRYTPGISKPQLRLTTCDGDSVKLGSSSTKLPKSELDDGQDQEVVYHQDWLMVRRPSSKKPAPKIRTVSVDIEPRTPFLQTFLGPVPTTRKKGSGRMWTEFPMNSLPPQDNTQPVDHEYDSLVFPGASSSTSTTCLIKDDAEGETRL